MVFTELTAVTTEPLAPMLVFPSRVTPFKFNTLELLTLTVPVAKFPLKFMTPPFWAVMMPPSATTVLRVRVEASTRSCPAGESHEIDDAASQRHLRAAQQLDDACVRRARRYGKRAERGHGSKIQ